jgi:hypothetical protein
LFDLYIALLQHLAFCAKTVSLSFSKFWLTICRLLHKLAHAVENFYNLADVVLRQIRVNLLPSGSQREKLIHWGQIAL